MFLLLCYFTGICILPLVIYDYLFSYFHLPIVGASRTRENANWSFLLLLFRFIASLFLMINAYSFSRSSSKSVSRNNFICAMFLRFFFFDLWPMASANGFREIKWIDLNVANIFECLFLSTRSFSSALTSGNFDTAKIMYNKKLLKCLKNFLFIAVITLNECRVSTMEIFHLTLSFIASSKEWRVWN